MPKINEDTRAFNELHWPKKEWVSERTVRGVRPVECPRCGNADMEQICRLRPDFYQCERCLYTFDKDVTG